MSDRMICPGLQVEQLVQRLQRYNEWRRGNEDIEQPHPRQIGEDIDEAMRMLLAMSGAIEATLDKNLHLADSDDCTLVDIAMVARGDKKRKDA